MARLKPCPFKEEDASGRAECVAFLKKRMRVAGLNAWHFKEADEGGTAEVCSFKVRDAGTMRD